VSDWAVPEDMEGAIAYLLWLMAHDRKSTPLKAIQGRIWEQGFKSGELRGEVFDDVPEALKRWTEEGKRVFIFSSGSVLAQKLIFRGSSAGDLSHFISGYFDTETGPKRKAESYSKIASEIGVQTGRVLFASDVPEELAAAREGAMKTVLLSRPGNKPVGPHDFEVASDFRKL